MSVMAIFRQQNDWGLVSSPILALLGVGFRAPHLSAIPFTLVHELGTMLELLNPDH
jgi:hypothetical protein